MGGRPRNTRLWLIDREILVALGVLRAAMTINPLLRLTRWLFDVDRHPIKVVGMMIAAIVWLGSIVYGFV